MERQHAGPNTGNAQTDRGRRDAVLRNPERQIEREIQGEHAAKGEQHQHAVTAEMKRTRQHRHRETEGELGFVRCGRKPAAHIGGGILNLDRSILPGTLVPGFAQKVVVGKCAQEAEGQHQEHNPGLPARPCDNPFRSATQSRGQRR